MRAVHWRAANGSKHYQLRAKFGNDVVEFEDAYRFPPILTDFDLYLLGEVPISASMTSSARIR